MTSEYRQDPVTKQWSILSPIRAKRPEAFVEKKSKKPAHKQCPFCEGSEKMTPKEVYAIRKLDTKPNEPGWDVRVIPNKFPVFRPKVRNISANGDFFAKMPAFGVHEVVVTKDTARDIGRFDQKQTRQLVDTYIRRFIDIKNNPESPNRYILIMQNHGIKSGASLAHPHSQIFGFENYSNSLIEKELMGSRDYWIRNKKCIFCQILKKEISEKGRIVWGNDSFIAFCPYASRYPFETWIVPRRHTAFFEDLSGEDAEQFSEALRVVLKKIHQGLGDPDYNFYIHTAPTSFLSLFEKEEVASYYHWHLEIVPRMTSWGGFEFATNMVINPIAPKESAKFLRKISAK